MLARSPAETLAHKANVEANQRNIKRNQRVFVLKELRAIAHKQGDLALATTFGNVIDDVCSGGFDE